MPRMQPRREVGATIYYGCRYVLVEAGLAQAVGRGDAEFDRTLPDLMFPGGGFAAAPCGTTAGYIHRGVPAAGDALSSDVTLGRGRDASPSGRIRHRQVTKLLTIPDASLHCTRNGAAASDD